MEEKKEYLMGMDGTKEAKTECERELRSRTY